jgi:hypothetical protein
VKLELETATKCVAKVGVDGGFDGGGHLKALLDQKQPVTNGGNAVERILAVSFGKLRHSKADE